MHDDDVKDLIRLGRNALGDSRAFYLDSIKRIKIGLERAKKESFYKTTRTNNEIDDLIEKLNLKISKAEKLRKNSREQIKELCKSDLFHVGSRVLCKECKKFYNRSHSGCKTEVLVIKKEFIKVACRCSTDGEAFVSGLSIALLN